jgi:hypothetical protein
MMWSTIRVSQWRSAALMKTITTLLCVLSVVEGLADPG